MSESDAAKTPEEIEIEQLARARRRARGLRLAARRALTLARRYRDEEGPRGQREIACVAQAMTWRTAARALRAEALAVARPGLARASAPTREEKRRTG
ncbi:MAG TPA: hypothetical protein VM580_12730 [Labilithrix sp.]|nr:hypothetical protein [Labilithrix sp.]